MQKFIEDCEFKSNNYAEAKNGSVLEASSKNEKEMKEFDKIKEN